MSPTYFAVRQAELNADLETARLAGNIPAMQTALAGLTALTAAMYGQPVSQSMAGT